MTPSPTLEAGSSPGVSQVSDTGEQSGEPEGNRTNGSDGNNKNNESNGNIGEATPGAAENPVDPGVSESPGKPASSDSSGVEAGPEAGPEDKTLEVSIPEMGRVENDKIPNTTGTDESALRENVAIHLEGTGYPWQREANVYMAGHRIGYPGTESFLGFFDLNKLEKGDKIHVKDAEGGRYTYRVYREDVVRPTDMTITEPIQGRNILTLQTCTLPNYTQRLVVQAEKVA